LIRKRVHTPPFRLNLTHNSMIDYIFQEFLTAKSKKSKKFLLEDRVLPCYIQVICKI
jgi:hypothetical protein